MLSSDCRHAVADPSHDPVAAPDDAIGAGILQRGLIPCEAARLEPQLQRDQIRPVAARRWSRSDPRSGSGAGERAQSQGATVMIPARSPWRGMLSSSLAVPAPARRSSLSCRSSSRARLDNPTLTFCATVRSVRRRRYCAQPENRQAVHRGGRRQLPRPSSSAEPSRGASAGLSAAAASPIDGGDEVRANFTFWRRCSDER